MTRPHSPGFRSGRRHLAAGLLGLVFLPGALGQTLIFTENFGSPASTTAINAYSGWQNQGTHTFAGTADVRSSSPSGAYSGASGGGNVFFTTSGGPSLTISGLDTSGYQAGSLSLSFGAFKNTTASDLTALSVSYSTNGSSFTALSFAPQPTGAGTTGWRLISITGTAIPASPTVSLRWSSTSATTQFRIDDVLLTGTAIPEPSTYAAIAGLLGFVGAALWRRHRPAQRPAMKKPAGEAG